MPRGLLLRYMGIGFLIALHWLCFYGAIKLANSSIALICVATVAFFTSLIEPIFVKRKFDMLELVLGFLIVPSMFFVVQNVDVSHMNGVWAGLGAALLAACFSILNKKYIDEASPYAINFIEISSATLLVTFIIPFFSDMSDMESLLPPRTIDWIYLLLLALVCTTLANVITLKALKHLSAFASNLVFNFEPLYGIILAAVLLKEYEQLTPEFYLGGAMIVAIVMLYPVLKNRIKQ